MPDHDHPDHPPAPKHRVRSIDLAKALGVSRTAVSFVLNDSPHAAKISEANRERIRSLARAWNYFPNHAATALRGQRSGTIGVVFADLGHSWAERILRGMLRVLEDRDTVALVSMSLWDEERERAEIRSMMKRQVDAIAVVAPTIGNLHVYEDVVDSDTPLVFMGDALVETEDFHRVVWDEGAAIRAAMEHLSDTGRTRICLVESDYPSLVQRERREAFLGFRDGATSEGDIVEVGRAQPVRASLSAFLTASQETPDAFLATNDALALDVLERLNQEGLGVPDRVAVMGLGDLPASSLPMVSLSTVRSPTELMGEETAKLLTRLIDDPDQRPTHVRLPSDEVIARRTTLGDA